MWNDGRRPRGAEPVLTGRFSVSGNARKPEGYEEVEGEVPLAVAESERPEKAASGNALEEVVVEAAVSVTN